MVNNVHNLGNKTFNLLFYFYICINPLAELI